MTEIGPKTQTPALIGDADASASKDPLAFLSVGGFENLLDALLNLFPLNRGQDLFHRMNFLFQALSLLILL